MQLILVLVLAAALVGCSTFDDTDSVSLADAGTEVDVGAVDSSIDCSETDLQACSRRGLNCGVHSVSSSCGGTRTIECGNCKDPASCGGGGAEGVCGCTGEPDNAFCSDVGKDCGVVMVTDSCGDERNVSCGRCTAPAACGPDNVCGCPCRIDGLCRAANSENPDNSCEYCAPARDSTGWSIGTGACDDTDLCTMNDMCDATGVCIGEPKVCPPTAAECEQDVCNPVTGACELAKVADGVSCTADNFTCTADLCRSGVCAHELQAGSCVIDGICVPSGELNPANDCQECIPALDAQNWTDTALNTDCADNDVFSCTRGQCSAGVCIAKQTNTACLIDSVCYSAGQTRPMVPCFFCDPAADNGDWSLRGVGFACRPTCECTAVGSCENIAIMAICL